MLLVSGASKYIMAAVVEITGPNYGHEHDVNKRIGAGSMFLRRADLTPSRARAGLFGAPASLCSSKYKILHTVILQFCGACGSLDSSDRKRN